MIGAGALDRRITIRRGTSARDGTYNAVVQAWADWLADVPASMRQSPGREFLEANAIVSERRAVFVIRYVAGLLITDQVVYEAREFNLSDIREIGRRRFLELQCEAVE